MMVKAGDLLLFGKWQIRRRLESIFMMKIAQTSLNSEKQMDLLDKNAQEIFFFRKDR